MDPHLSTATTLTDTEMALHLGDAVALRSAVEEDAQGIQRMMHPPYKFALRALEVRNNGAPVSATQDANMAALFDIIHRYASPAQNHRKELRLAAEMAVARDCHRAAMSLLDKGASLTNQLGVDLLKTLWADPDRALAPARVNGWQNGQSFKRQEWEHRALCTMAVAGASIQALDAFQAAMHSPLSAKEIANGMRHTFLSANARSKFMGTAPPAQATPQSTTWISKRLGNRGLAPLLEELDPGVAFPLTAFLRAQLQAAELDQASSPRAARRGNPRL